MSGQVTRGNGFLEAMLARKRAEMANRLIPEGMRTGRILDIGCGTSPYFLRNTAFREKHGVDRLDATATAAATAASDGGGILLRHFDVASGDRLPFQGDFFDTVSMLAVLEHLDSGAITGIVAEVHRVLKPGGLFVGTTPAGWADGILRAMARVGLVSREEIEEHQTRFTRGKLGSIMADAGFSRSGIRTGSFEAGMNLWVVARKGDGSRELPQGEKA